eukprot:2451775-Lingulodinium_polyedra.AAC.1
MLCIGDVQKARSGSPLVRDLLSGFLRVGWVWTPRDPGRTSRGVDLVEWHLFRDVEYSQQG